MKPHLPLALLYALLAALLPVETLRAETLFALGGTEQQLTESSRFSDTGKGCYFSESYNYYQPYKGAGDLYKENGNWDFMGAALAPSVNRGSSSVSGALGGLTHDVSMCWANATANVMQYWESYYGIFYDGSNGALPYGWNYDPTLAETLGGSQSLTIYNEFYQHWYDEGGTFKWASDWYCRRVDPSKLYIKDEGTGGWWENWFGEDHAYAISYYDGNSNIDTLTRNFAAALGYTAQSDGSWAQTTQGQIGYLGISSYLGGHALTCWGMELGEDNRVKAIYITNSDDLTYQLVKLYLKSEGGQYYLFNDEECTEFWNWNAANWYLDEVSYLNTPQALKDLYSEYSHATLTWTGAAAEWSDASSADSRIGYALPGKDAGWVTTVRGKSYDSYFDTRRHVLFDDSAAVTDIRTGGQLTAGKVVLANTAKTYTFAAGAGGCRLTADSLTAETAGSAVFSGTDITVGSLLLDGYTLSVNDGSLGAESATLQGGASLTLENSTAAFTDLLLGSGTTLTLDLSLAGDETALISVSGSLVTEGALTLNVHNLPTDLSELYMVISTVGGEGEAWNSQTVTLNGTTSDLLFWRDGVLYYGSYVDKQHLFFTAHTEAPEKWRKFEGLSFSGIRYQENGAALTNTQELRLEKNGPVLFEDNVSDGSGGALANSGSLAAEGNKTLTFRSNQASERGGALFNAGGSIAITGSQAVNVAENTALAGGAVSQSGGSLAVSGNGSVLFSANRATSSGGAVELEGGTMHLTDNDTLTFVGNRADGNGGALSNIGGRVSISGNGSTAFTDNRAGGQGGAVYNAEGGRVIIKADAGDVVFRGNTQGSGSDTVLRALHSQGDLHSDDLSENISAGEGHRVVFYDAVRVENSTWYGQSNLNTEGSGSIVFSGAYAADDLRRLTGSAPTESALRESRSSVFTGSIYLAGGTLRIEDGASVSADSLYTADGAARVGIALSNGSLHTPEYSLTFGTNKSLELTGTNVLESSYIAFYSESTLTFNLSAEHADTAALTLITSDRFDMQGSLTLNLNGLEDLESGRYQLITTSHGVLYDCSLTLNGGYAEALSWEDGTLWYDSSYVPPVVVPTDLVFTETLSGSFTYSGNDSLTFTTGSARAINESGNAPADVLLAENGAITFSGMNVMGNGGAIVNVSQGKDAPSLIVIQGNGPIEFSGIKATDDGGIIANTALNGGDARIDISGNGILSLLNGTASVGRGGALFNSGVVNMSGNGEVSLGDNAADKDGGAVYNAEGACLTICENAGLNLARNTTEGRGGAVANYGELHLDANNFVVASGNSSLYGAALYNEGLLTMEGNGYVQFAGNDCVKNGADYSDFGLGGNICNSEEGEIRICDNGSISLSSTYALYGGGIYNEGRIVIENNLDVAMNSNSVEQNGGALFNAGGTFSLSHNQNVTFNEDWAWGGYGGTICNMEGTVDIKDNASLAVYSSYCALSNGNTSGSGKAEMNIIGNGGILFYDNIAYRTKDKFKGMAGAVYNHANGTLNICGNGDVEFHNNTVLMFAEASPTGKDASYLHALHNEGTLNLSAKGGKSIVFYDGISSAKGSVVNLNKEYTDVDGKVQNAAGDIVFSGVRVESTLYSNMLAEFVTPELIAMSKTSTLETEVLLHGGRLVVMGDARLTADALTALAGSGSTVRVEDAELNVKEALTLQRGTKLETEGASRMSVGTLNLLSGSTLAFVLSSTNLTESALTLSGTLNTERLSVSLGDTSYLEKGSTYALLTATDYKTDAWTAENITIATDGVLFEDLVWDKGTLYLHYADHAVPPTLTWGNASGDGVWNAASLNWLQKDTAAAYADGMKIEFRDKGAGKVTLVGALSPKSVLVDSAYDYAFEGKGKLTGAMQLTKQGAGTLSIATANDYTGGTVVNGGTLVVGNAAALGSGAVSVNGATLEVAANGYGNEMTFDGTSSLVVDAGYQLVLSKMLANNGTLTIGGTLDVSALTLKTTAATHLDVNGNSGASGFAKDAAYAVQVVNGGSVVNNGATVTHGSRTLTLGTDGMATAGGAVDNGTYLLTGSDKVTTAAIHGKSNDATVSMNGGTLTVNDTAVVNATGGKLTLSGGTLNGTLSGTNITAASGTIAAALTGNNTLTGSNFALQTALTNRGTLTIGGTLDVSALTLNTTAATHIDVNGKSGASGFAKVGSASVQVVNGGTVVNNGATVKHGSLELTLNSNGTATTEGSIDYGTYLLTGTSTVTTSAIHAKNSSATISMNGGTLTVNDTAIVNATGGKLTLTGGTLNGTLSGTSITATSGTIAATLTGNNTLTGSNYALKSSIANNGTLTIGGTLDVSALTLNTTAATHIDVNGNSGASGFAKDAAYSVQVVNGGTVVNNGATVKHGLLELTLNSSGMATTEGTIDYGTYLLTGTSAATTSAIHAKNSSATISMNGGTLTVNDTATVNTTAGKITLSGGTLNGTLSGTSITATNGRIAATLTGNNTLTGSNYALKCAIANSGTLTIGGTLDVSALTLNTTAATHIDVNGNSGASGFAKMGSASVLVVDGGKVVNNCATVKHGSLELTLNSNGTATTEGAIDYGTYLLTGTSTATTSAIHAKNSSATISMNGGTLTVNDTATVNATGGSVMLSSGTLNGTLSGTTITATNGTIAATLTGNNTVTGSNYALKNVIANNGTLTIGGTLDVSALTLNTTAATYIDVNGNSGASGFAKMGSASVLVVDGGKVVNNGATVKHGSLELTLNSDGMATKEGTVDYGTYLLTGTSAATTSAIHAKNSSATISMNGGTLTVNDTATVNTTAGKITLSGGTLNGTLSGTTITATNGTISTTLAGNNTLTGSNYALKSSIANNGILTIGGTLDVSALTLNTTAATYIDVNGNSGACGFAKDAAYSVQVVNGGTVVNNGAIVTHGSHNLSLDSNGVATDGGTIHYDTYLLTGTGAATTSAIHGKSSAATVSMNGGTLTVNDATTVNATGGAVVLSGGTLNGSLNDTAILANGGTLSADVSGSKTLTVGGKVTLTGKVSTSVMLNSGCLTADSGMALADGQSLTFNGGGMTGDILTTAGSTLALNSAATLTGALTLDGGSLALNGKTLTLTGALNLQGETALDVSSYGIGTYRLLAFEELVGSVDNLRIDSKRYRYALAQENNALTLTVKALNNTLTWNQPKGVWTTNTNFSDGTFREDDDVIFLSAAKVTISGSVQPGVIVVNTPDMVTFTSDKKVYGSGISGDASVSKSGSGLLTMNAGNTYSGGTTLNAGTLKATAVDSFGDGTITVNGGTLDLGSKAVANDIVLSGEATFKGDSKFTGAVSVNGKATLLAKTSYKGMTTIGSGNTLTLAPKATMAGSITIDGGTLNISAPKGMTLAKDAMMLFNSGTVSGLLTIGAKSELVWQDGTFETSAPVLKGGTVDLGGWNALTLTGSKAQVQFGDKVLELPGKGTVRTDETLVVNSGTVTVNSVGGYEGEMAVNSGTLKLSTGKVTTENKIVVNGTAAVVNGGTHYGNITVDGLLAKGTNIKLLDENQKVALNGDGTMLGTISGKGIIDVNADINATAAKLTAATINLNGGTFTNTKGIKLAKGQTLTLAGASLDLGPKGALATVAGSTLVVDSNTTLTGSLTLGGGELVFNNTTLELDGTATLTLSKAMIVTGSGTIHYTTLKAPKKLDLEKLFGEGVELDENQCTLTFNGGATESRLAAAPLATAEDAPAQLDAAPSIPVVNPVTDAMVQADWGILDAERAFMGAVNSRHQHAALLDKGRGAAWVSAFGASVRHGNQGMHHGSDGNIEGAAFGLEHAVSETGTLGLAVGRSKNRLAATGVTHLRQETAHVALYGQKQLKHGFTADAAATYGDTETKLGAASWTQKSAALTARLTHAKMLSDATAFRTFGGITYEATDAGSIGTAHTGSVQNLRAELGAGATHTAGKAHLYAEAALTGDMVRHNPTVDFGGARTHGANPGRLGLRATVGGLYEFTDTWSGTASYGIEAESRSTSHTLNIGVSKNF